MRRNNRATSRSVCTARRYVTELFRRVTEARGPGREDRKYRSKFFAGVPPMADGARVETAPNLPRTRANAQVTMPPAPLRGESRAWIHSNPRR